MVNEEMDLPMPEADDIKALLERFHRAGWITGFSGVDGHFAVQYTPLGIERIQTLRQRFKDVKQGTDVDFKSLSAGEARRCVAELLPPKLSQKEAAALFGFIWQFNEPLT